MNDDELRTLVDELPEAHDVLRTARGYVVKARPDAAAAAAAGTALQALDAWVVAHGGQVRTARGAGTGGMRPGRRTAPPPAPPQRVYVVPAEALGD